MWIRSTSEWLPSGCLPLGQAQAWTWPQLDRQRAGAALPSPTPAADHHWAQMVGMTCGRISPATATRRATGHRGWESGLGWGCYRQATANGVSKRRPNFHHQLPSTKAVPDVGNDRGFRVPTRWLPESLRVAFGSVAVKTSYQKPIPRVK